MQGVGCAMGEREIERRRTIRIRRSALLGAKLEGLDRPSIKIAETLDEWQQAFGVVYQEYLKSGYIKKPEPPFLQYSLYNLLPKTCVFIFKSYLKVVSTLTYIPDTELFGLPMDALYNKELDALRSKGRKVVELGGLATESNKRWRNLVIFLCKAMFHYAAFTNVNDLCIMVNPKHVRFYNMIFLFEPFGEEKFYKAVGAPAVALRVNFDRIAESLRKAYGDNDFDTDLHAFFTKVNYNPADPDLPRYEVERKKSMDYEAARFFLKTKPEILCGLNEAQRAYFERLYHQAIYWSSLDN